jgi:hypothetical protein
MRVRDYQALPHGKVVRWDECFDLARGQVGGPARVVREAMRINETGVFAGWRHGHLCMINVRVHRRLTDKRRFTGTTNEGGRWS